MRKFQTGILNQGLHDKVEVRTMHAYWPSSEEICNEYAVQNIHF